MPKIVTVSIVVPNAATDTEIEQWVEGIGDELQDAPGEKWVIVGHKIGTKPTAAELAAFNKGQDEEDEEDEDDDEG